MRIAGHECAAHLIVPLCQLGPQSKKSLTDWIFSNQAPHRAKILPDVVLALIMRLESTPAVLV